MDKAKNLACGQSWFESFLAEVRQLKAQSASEPGESCCKESSYPAVGESSETQERRSGVRVRRKRLAELAAQRGGVAAVGWVSKCRWAAEFKPRKSEKTDAKYGKLSQW